MHVRLLYANKVQLCDRCVLPFCLSVCLSVCRSVCEQETHERVNGRRPNMVGMDKG